MADDAGITPKNERCKSRHGSASSNITETNCAADNATIRRSASLPNRVAIHARKSFGVFTKDGKTFGGQGRHQHEQTRYSSLRAEMIQAKRYRCQALQSTQTRKHSARKDKLRTHIAQNCHKLTPRRQQIVKSGLQCRSNAQKQTARQIRGKEQSKAQGSGANQHRGVRGVRRREAGPDGRRGVRGERQGQTGVGGCGGCEGERQGQTGVGGAGREAGLDGRRGVRGVRGKSQTGIGGAGLLLISMTARPWRLRGSGAGWRACNGRRHGCVARGAGAREAESDRHGRCGARARRA